VRREYRRPPFKYCGHRLKPARPDADAGVGMPGKLLGKQVLMVIAPENFRDEEYAEPRRILEREGAVVKVASTKVVQATGMLGLKVNVGSSLEGLKVQDYDAVVVVGGSGSPRHLWTSQTLHGLVREADRLGKVVAAICLSPAVLAKAGLLAGKKATVYDGEGAMDELRRGGATLASDVLVRDGRIITASGPEAAAAFGDALVEALTATPK